VQFPGSRLLIFARAPVVGRVKTRLIPALGPAGAARLQAGLTRALSRRFAGSGLCPLELWVEGDPDHPLLRELALRHGIALRVQSGSDLGERMHRAASDALAEAESAVLIGSDCPQLGVPYLRQALSELALADAVLGPAEDGGYVLLGLKRPAAELFQGVPWGTERVAAITRQRLRRLGWHWRELPALWDLDRPEDLARARLLPDAGDWLPTPDADSG
jgi:rSAM/selenodomain-associated transferase 1